MPQPVVRKLPRQCVEKVWGVDRLPAALGLETDRRIGEIWFTPPAEMPELLVKHIFTSERLSVQTHPDDAQAAAKGLGETGKSECWLISSAEPGATIAVGFDEPVDRERMRTAALDGSIVDLLTWHEVEPGDFFYIPANTVHAIGAGVGLVEVQQNSDITYRLYDYGRPRELHLDDGIAVADGAPYPASLKCNLAGTQNRRIVTGPHFALEVVTDAKAVDLERFASPNLVIPTRSSAVINGEEIAFGECAWVEALSSLELAQEAQILVARPLP